ncbi:MAG: hypothetical protein LBT00_07510 [Spirochaetaceae bacterium]|jgi:hypothetical protein|nr:hypothetical protein [Spirochaetaceae bacterium]
MVMKNRIFFVGFFLMLINVSSLMAVPNSFPELRVLVSTDNGQSWTENLKDLHVDEPFYLRIDASIRFRGKKLPILSPKEEALLSFALPKDFDMSLTDKNVNGHDNRFLVPITAIEDAFVNSVKPQISRIIYYCEPKNVGTYSFSMKMSWIQGPHWILGPMLSIIEILIKQNIFSIETLIEQDISFVINESGK